MILYKQFFNANKFTIFIRNKKIFIFEDLIFNGVRQDRLKITRPTYNNNVEWFNLLLVDL